MRVKLIVNPRAGVCRHKFNLCLQEIERKFKEKGCDADLFITKKRGDTLMEARKSLNYEAIAVAGGDGTINEVVNGIVGACRGTFPACPYLAPFSRKERQNGYTVAQNKSRDMACRVLTLGVIPLGTVNLFAKEVGIPETPLEPRK